ncbi:MAG: NAD(P)H-dependent glycerol-3-phosphate dehydrogenase, partial [Bacteroidota bacterium]
VDLAENIIATNSFEQIAEECNLIFPVIPSAAFKQAMQNISPYLRPDHILIHATKGFGLKDVDVSDLGNANITRYNVKTMSEIILDETVVKRVGCLSGPNLSKEILANQPTATVIASQFDEVISLGVEALSSKAFFVFGSHDILGAELAGALKNIFALGSGILAGKGLGKNVQAMLITRGLHEMASFGNAMGSEPQSFFGTSGVGDLVATATSDKSRNYTFGYRFAQGEDVNQIVSNMNEVAEGVRTLKIAQQLAKYYRISVPITNMLYRVVFEGYDVKRAILQLMRYPLVRDVSF